MSQVFIDASETAGYNASTWTSAQVVPNDTATGWLYLIYWPANSGGPNPYTSQEVYPTQIAAAEAILAILTSIAPSVQLT